jgi:hypothetical protein
LCNISGNHVYFLDKKAIFQKAENIFQENGFSENREYFSGKQSPFRPKRSYGMGLSVCLSVTPLLQHLENHMSKGKKGNRPERQLAALAKQALRTSVYI